MKESTSKPTPRPMSPEARGERREQEIRRRLGCPYLDDEEASIYLLVSRATLADHRVKGTGPTYRKHFGRVVYHIDDLEAWSATRKRRSTSDKPVAATEADFKGRR